MADIATIGGMRAALEPVFACRGDAAHADRVRRVLLGPCVPTLADDLTEVLVLLPLGASCSDLARRLARRKADVLAALRSDARFVLTGRGRGSRWRVAAARHLSPAWEPQGTHESRRGMPGTESEPAREEPEPDLDTLADEVRL